MHQRDKRIDTYIAKSVPFARPILSHFRDLIHKTCPEVEEKIKWSFPHFDYKGEMMCSMASFKHHCAISFWKASLMKDAAQMKERNKDSMGQYGKILKITDLPPDKTIISNIKEAMSLNDNGIKIFRGKKPEEAKVIILPEELISALKNFKKAKVIFEKFSQSHKSEYVKWISEAKTEEIKTKRIATAIKWLTEGKTRYWKYLKK